MNKSTAIDLNHSTKVDIIESSNAKSFAKCNFWEAENNDTIILGAGLAGLSAAYTLGQSKCSFHVYEKMSSIGGLARTIEYKGFRFDLGGHRFISNYDDITNFVTHTLDTQCRWVGRRSKIYIQKTKVEYPIQVRDIGTHFGLGTCITILKDYIKQRIANIFRRKPVLSLKDWVLSKYGQSLYEMFFKPYSEKVWGLDCTQIDKDWISQRIQGLSFIDVVQQALFKNKTHQYASFTDKFLYPRLGIGEIAKQLNKKIGSENISLNSNIISIHHFSEDNSKEKTAQYMIIQNDSGYRKVKINHLISTMPLSNLVKLLSPTPPSRVVQAAKQLRSRDLTVVVLMFNKTQISNESWIYFPDKDISFGRIHEPKNWSKDLAPHGQTALVCEYFCFKDDGIWALEDKQLVNNTIDELRLLKLLNKKNCADDVIDYKVLRIPNAYPLFELGYQKNLNIVEKYLSEFTNLHISGRTGAFRYYNMDETILNGKRIAERVLKEINIDSEINYYEQLTSVRS